MDLKNRVLVSFDGECPYHCKHCYTYGLHEDCNNITSDDIVKSLEDQEFDVIYVSHNKENFINPNEGLELCEKLYDKYHVDMIAITRNVFNEEELNRLVKLNEKMKSYNHMFVLAVSIPAKQSIDITEGNEMIPSPSKRVEFLKSAHDAGIKTILVVRPLYPNNIIKTDEILELIDDAKSSVDAILSSGLAVNDDILKQLNMNESDFKYLDGDNSNYLIGAIGNTKYIDVTEELKVIKNKCDELNIPLFAHSLKAINYLKNN